MLFLVSCAVKMVDTVQCRMFPVVSQSGQLLISLSSENQVKVMRSEVSQGLVGFNR
jgi:hypothetical protein